MLNNLIRFQLISQTWVALHPHPKGIIQFLGGALFGSFPTIFYRHFLTQLFEAGYTIIIYPFQFGFRHLPVARKLQQQRLSIQQKIMAQAQRYDYHYKIYQDIDKYYWVGHSLGGKYVALLEILGKNIAPQKSLLIAPVMSDTKEAIQIPFLAKIIDKLGLGVYPTQEQTRALIKNSDFLNLTALLSFSQDEVAGSQSNTNLTNSKEKNSDVFWLVQQMQKSSSIYQEISGKHLAPLGVKLNNNIIDLNYFQSGLKTKEFRNLESVVTELLNKL